MDSDDKKITQLTRVTSLSDSDLLVVTIDVGTAPKTRAIEKSNLGVIGRVIEGMELIRNSATSLSVGTGLCYAENGDRINITSPLTASSLSLSVSTFYHVYVYLSGGSPAMEVVTTAPVAWKGTAYSKTGATTRRYIGSVVTDGSGNVRNFRHNVEQGKIFYVGGDLATSPFRVISNGTATSSTAISLAGVVPITGVGALARFANTDATLYVYLSIITVSSTVYDLYLNGTLRAIFDFYIENQNINYIYVGGTPSSGLYIDLLGYSFKR